MFEVWIRGEKVKEYQHKIQAVIYLAMHGLVYGNCFKGYWIDPKAQIKEIRKLQKLGTLNLNKSKK